MGWVAGSWKDSLAETREAARVQLITYACTLSKAMTAEQATNIKDE